MQSRTHLSDVEVMRQTVHHSANFSDALDALADVTAEMGFEHVLYGYIPAPPKLRSGDWLPLKLNLRNFPAGFEGGWQQFMRVDPYYRACFDTTLPIAWKDVQRQDNLIQEQKQACNYLADYGLRNGITIPVHLPFGRFAVMSAVAHRNCRDWESLRQKSQDRLFHLMHGFTQAIHDRNMESQIPTGEILTISAREKECLEWASAGKTSAEIAIIIDRSVETVRLHIKNAITKLNASNRAQAIATALQLGLI